jgi:glycosyltransferase involved in cell wall biosynthesis
MYCGSCLRDNSLARELRRLGHDVTLVPVYTPTRTDEANESASTPVLFGGISVYLQHKSVLFRHTPWLLDRLWDSRWALHAAAQRSLAVDPASLGHLTVAMLEGARGPIAKEFHKLQSWLRHQPRPDILQLPNSLLLALGSASRDLYDGALCCTLQGEDLFLRGLIEPFRSRSLELIRRHLPCIDAFLSVSRQYSDDMAVLLGIPKDKIHTVSLGVDSDAFPLRRDRADGVFTLGYLARIAPEKGLHLLAEAWRKFRTTYRQPARLCVAGYLAPEHRPYLNSIRDQMAEWKLAHEFDYRGELDRAAKSEFLASLDAFSVPAAYDDPKALYLLEAMAAGVPVAAPRRGALLEHVETTHGGILCEPDDPATLAQALLTLATQPALHRELSAAARSGVARHYSLHAMAENTLAVYRSLLRPSARSASSPA